MATEKSSLSLLRKRIERIRQERGQQKRVRWPKELRLEVAAFYRQGSLSLGALGRELSLPMQTLANWSRQEASVCEPKALAAFEPLQIKPDPCLDTVLEGPTLYTPRGFSLRGLSFLQVLELCRREVL
jgi:hypothetical protein